MEGTFVNLRTFILVSEFCRSIQLSIRFPHNRRRSGWPCENLMNSKHVYRVASMVRFR
jgi:hypothetical protein